MLKLHVEEPGSEAAVPAWQAADAVVCSRLVHVEARAAVEVVATADLDMIHAARHHGLGVIDARS